MSSFVRFVTLNLLNVMIFVVVVVVMNIAVISRSSTSSIQAHVCIHDSHILPYIRNSNPPKTLPQESTMMRANANRHNSNANERFAQVESSYLGDLSTDPTDFKVAPGAAPIRINVSTLDLFNASHYCTAVGEFKPDFKGGTLNCSDAASIFTQEKRDTLINILLPYAFDRVNQILNVKRLATPIVGLSAGTCYPFTIPQSHIDSGVVNADVAFYVAAGPTPQGNIAWAGMCASDADGRPIVGRMNCGPRYIPSPPLTADDIDTYARTLIHEAFHALGFSYDIWTSGFNTPNRSSAVSAKTIRGGVPSSQINTSRVVNATRYFYNCSSATGAELELEGGAGTALSHWNRRTNFESVMVGIAGKINKIDLMTLSLFADMGYYWINASAVEPMYFGNNTQCDLIDKKCTDPTNNKKTKDLFCVDHQQTSRACDYNLKSIGQCGIVNFTSALPAYWQYFPSFPKQGGAAQLMEYCPFTVGYNSYFCPEGNISTGSDAEHIYGYTWGASSRCIVADSLIQNNYATPTTDPTRCLGVKCVYENCDDPRASSFYSSNNCTYRLQIRVRSDPYLDCPSDGSAGIIPANYSFYGDISCPLASDICDPSSRGYGDDLIYERLTTTTTSTAPTGNNGTTTTTSTSMLSPTTTTTVGVLTSVSSSTTAPPPPPTSSATTTDTTSSISGSGVSPSSSTSSATSLVTTTTTGNTQTTSTSVVTSSSSSSTSTSVSTSATTSYSPTTTTDPSNNNNGAGSLTGQVDPTACFLHNLPCWVSYIIVALAALFIVLIIWWIYKKFCSSNNNDAGKSKNSNQHGRNNEALSPVDLALLGGSGGGALYHNATKQPPALAPKGKYELMAEQMKTMSPREVNAAVYQNNFNNNNNNNYHGSATPPLVSPSARYVDPSMQQLSPRQAPIFTDDDL